MILDIDKWCNETIINKNYIPEITSSTIKQSNGVYDPNGLFSTDIFGQERGSQWRNQYAKIVLPHPVIHPAIFYIINRRISYLLKFINMEIGFVATKNQGLVLTNVSSNYSYCGINDLYQNSRLVCDALMRTPYFETDTAKTILTRMMDRKIPMFTSNVIVMPPIFRPEDSDQDANNISINKTYTKILDECAILRSSLTSKDKVLIGRILANLQNLYNQLFNSMINKIKGKQGLVRAALLGKNADFSGRAVIVGDPYIKPSQLGVPRTMLIKLFYPWIIHEILTDKGLSSSLEKYGVACNIARLYDLINTDIFEKNVDAGIVQILNGIMEKVIQGKVIIAKRDPVLHKLSVRGFYPVPVDDSSIHISPVVCEGFNADFDGDQMAIFVPLTNRTQQIVREEMLSTKNIYHPLSGLSFAVNIDFVFGLYVITKDDVDKSVSPVVLKDNTDIVDLLFKSESFAKNVVTYRGRTNTIGRRVVELIFNDHIVADEPFVKKKIAKSLQEIAKKYPDELEDVLYRITKIAAVTSSIYGGTMSVKDFKISEDLKKRRDDVISHPDKYDVDTELDDITSKFIDETLSRNQLPTLLVKSGSRGNAGSMKQVAVAKGYISDATGKVLPDPIGSCFADGFKPVDYFTSSYGNRKGVVDRSQNTANSGYLQRQMIYLAAPVKSGDDDDCHTNRFFTLTLSEDYVDVLEGRFLSNGDILSKEYVQKHNLIGKKIQVYSPLYCKSRGLCARCYPHFYRDRNDTNNIGLISANIVGERASQLTMKQFHCFSGGNTVFVKINNNPQEHTFWSLFERYENREKLITNNGLQEEINLSSDNILVKSGDSWAKVRKIIRHRQNPSSPMSFLRTGDMHFLVLQDNHPVFAGGTFREPRDIIINKDRGRVSDFSSFWQNEKRDCFVEPYVLGVFLGDGCLIRKAEKRGRVIRGIEFSLPVKNKLDMREKLQPILSKYVRRTLRSDDRVVHVFSSKLGKDFFDNCGYYSRQKHFPYDYMFYSDETLAEILCGFVDADGSVILGEKNGREFVESVKFESVNFTILSQVGRVCDKLGIFYSITPKNMMSPSIQNNMSRFSRQIFVMNMYVSQENINAFFGASLKLSGKTASDRRSCSNRTDVFDKLTVLFQDRDEYVYDLETENETLDVNGILAHNTGGAASVLYITKEAPQMVEYVNQENNNLVAKKRIRIRAFNYLSENVEIVSSSDFAIQGLDESGNTTSDVAVKFPADIEFSTLAATNVKMNEDDGVASMDYEEGDVIGAISSRATDTSSSVLILQSIFNHANRFSTGDDLVLELFEIFKLSEKIPLIFFEVLVSQIIRDPDKKYYPYRYGPMTKPPFFSGIKQVPGLESPKRGIMFERILDVVTNSVLQGDSSNTDKRVSSDLEDLFDI